MRIGLNIYAMQAHSSLARSDKKLTEINKRLTTGLRVNTAGDDPATYTTATKLRMQIGGYEKAQQNSSNAISLIQTAEAALSTIESMVQRIRELSVQASNETNSSEDILKIQEEVSQLKLEIDATIRKADYNGIKVLNGDASAMEYKYTYNATAESTKLKPGTPCNLPNSELKGDITFTVKDIETSAETPVTITLLGGETAADILNLLNDPTNGIGNAGLRLSPAGPPAPTDYYDIESIDVIATGSKYKLTVSGENFLLDALGLSTFSGSTYERGKDAGLNLITKAEDPRSPLSDEAVLTEVSPNLYKIQDNRFTNNTFGFESYFTVGTNPPDGEAAIISEISTQPFVIQIGALQGTEMDISIPKISSSILNVDRVNVTTTEFAVKSIKLLDKILSDVLDIRSKVGSYQVRLEHTLGSLDSGHVTLSSSLSRIIDTDLAVEMSEYTQQNVIIQAALSVIAQSNQRPAEIAGLFNK